MSQKILVIDDDPLDLKMLKKNLEKAGYAGVFVAQSGEEGIELARNERPHLVIVDTLLPGINGHETCRRIKDNVGSAVPVIITTGAIDAVDAGRARKAGADDYVMKTVNYSHVIQAVDKIFGAAR